jgi:hypothetical protein
VARVTGVGALLYFVSFLAHGECRLAVQRMKRIFLICDRGRLWELLEKCCLSIGILQGTSITRTSMFNQPKYHKYHRFFGFLFRWKPSVVRDSNFPGFVGMRVKHTTRSQQKSLLTTYLDDHLLTSYDFFFPHTTYHDHVNTHLAAGVEINALYSTLEKTRQKK